MGHETFPTFKPPSPEIPTEFKRFFSNDPREVLGVPQNITEADLKRARDILIMEFHPDKNKNPLAIKIAKNINLAYTKLKKLLESEIDTQPIKEASATEKPKKETLEEEWAHIPTELRDFILNSTEEELNRRLHQLNLDPKTIELYQRFHLVFRTDRTKGATKPTSTKEETKTSKPKIEREQMIFDTIGEISYHVLEGNNYTYRSGLVAAKNKAIKTMTETPIRYPNDKEAKAILAQIKTKRGISRPIACFVEVESIRDVAFQYLSPKDEFVKKHKERVPADTTLFVVVVANEKK